MVLLARPTHNHATSLQIAEMVVSESTDFTLADITDDAAVQQNLSPENATHQLD